MNNCAEITSFEDVFNIENLKKAPNTTNQRIAKYEGMIGMLLSCGHCIP